MLDLSSLEKISVVENIHLSGTDDELVPRQTLATLLRICNDSPRLVIELRWNAHVKIMFYLALCRVCLGRVHLSYQLHW